jgi:hypothetical protein
VPSRSYRFQGAGTLLYGSERTGSGLGAAKLGIAGAAAEVSRLKETLLREEFLLRVDLYPVCNQRASCFPAIAFASSLSVLLLSQVASSIKRQPWTLVLPSLATPGQTHQAQLSPILRRTKER